MATAMVVVVARVLEIQQALASALGPCGIAPILAYSVQEARAIMSTHPISLIFCSDELDGDEPSLLIREANLRASGRVPVVMVSRLDDWKRYLDFLHEGAFDCLLHPPSRSEIERITRNMATFRNPSDIQWLDHAPLVPIHSQLH